MTLEHIEPDYDSEAEAWMEMEMTMAALHHRDECMAIAAEYERRKTAEAEKEQGT